MSARTRANRFSKPGVASVRKPRRFDRRTSHKAIRRRTQMLLQGLSDAEDLTLPIPHKSTVHVIPAEPVNTVKSKQQKVWKTKAWKRRTAERMRRIQVMRELQTS